ncbi:MAG: 4-hydroxythreonine-4-phosphate dehydrogenase PdxA [Bacteroidales bacterium]
MQEEDRKIRVAITHGDINGIGYEVILKTFAEPRMIELCTPVLYGSSKVMAYHRKNLDLPQVNYTSINSAEELNPNCLNLINCTDEDIKVEIGQSTQAAGEAALKALEMATADMRAGLIDILVTAPINKENIQSEKFDFPGHTEYLHSKFPHGNNVLMILVAENLRVAVATGHIPISNVSAQLNKTELFNKIKLLNNTLAKDFDIQRPRIAILGLNPHAGDGGVIGEEERETIIPAIKMAKDAGILCYGPFAADGFFGAGTYTDFDATLAMYHDQGLIPFKTLAMEKGVNYTAGLQIIRTSPDHGTGFDIAGKGVASEVSMREAIYLAIDAYRNRQRFLEANENPLRKQYYSRETDADLRRELAKEEEDPI